MSLTKKRRMTEKGLSARRRNARLSRGPVTLAGLARSRNARLLHAYYSKSEEAALRALGEDPDEFLSVLEGLRKTWRPETPAQDMVLGCLARTFVRIQRNERSRQGHALRQALEAEEGRETRLHAQMMKLKMTEDSIRRFARSVAQERYIASLDDLKKMKALHQEGAMSEMGEIAVALIFQLRQPGTPGLGQEGELEDEAAKARRVVEKVKEIFGIGMSQYPPPACGNAVENPPAPPAAAPADSIAMIEAGARTDPSEAEWDAREPVRQLLENILTHQADIYEARRRALLKDLVAGPSANQRAAEITPADSFVKLMHRLDWSNLRQALRLVELLAKMEQQVSKVAKRSMVRKSGDVTENKGISNEEGNSKILAGVENRRVKPAKKGAYIRQKTVQDGPDKLLKTNSH